MGDQEEGMDLADEVDMGGKVKTLAALFVLPLLDKASRHLMGHACGLVVTEYSTRWFFLHTVAVLRAWCGKLLHLLRPN